VITIIVTRMEKLKSVLREQAQQINFKSVLFRQNTFKSVLNCQNTFKNVFNLLDTFGRTLIFSKMRFSNIGDFKKIWNHTKIFFLVRPRIAPFFPQSGVFLSPILIHPSSGVKGVSMRHILTQWHLPICECLITKITVFTPSCL
jgi:hypothetical protein